MSDKYETLREAVEATPELRGEWRCWNGWGPVIGTDLMAVHRIGPFGEGGIQGHHAGQDGDVYAKREHAELVALACESVADLLADYDRLAAGLPSEDQETQR